MEGLKVARSAAILSYRPYSVYQKTQTGLDSASGKFRSATYQRYKGEEIAGRFNAFSYYLLLSVTDSHDVGRGRESVRNALAAVKAQTLVLSLAGDQRYPESEQKELASGIPDCEWHRIETDFGHDGFLIEADQISEKLAMFTDRVELTGALK